jgi:hypothetical protein
MSRIFNEKAIINVSERRFGQQPIDKESAEYKIHVEQMKYIDQHSKLKPRLGRIFNNRLLQPVNGDKRHPQHPYQYVCVLLVKQRIMSSIIRDIYLRTYDQCLIHAFLLLHPNSRDHYTYLICHQIEDLSTLVDRFYRNFGNVLIFDYRGYGNSSGNVSERGAYIDTQTAFDFLCNLDEIDRNRIIVYGVSMGVAPAIQLASEHHNGARIHACIFENGFTSVGRRESSDFHRVYYTVCLSSKK